LTAVARHELARRIGVAAIVVALIAGVFIAVFFVHKRYEMSLYPSQEIPWLASQLETEYLRTAQALQLYTEDLDVAHSEVILRFEVYWSRVDLMAQGIKFANINEESWHVLEPRLLGSLAALDSIIADPEFHHTQAGVLAIQSHLSDWPAIHGFSQETIRSVWTRNAAQERLAVITLVTTMAVALVLVICIAGIILVMARRQSALAQSERNSKELAQASNRERERFMASMNHELRTPLNAIIGFSEVMSLGKLGPLDQRYRDYAQDILTSGRHLLSLVNQVLDISSIAERKSELTLSRFRVSEVLHDCVKMVSPLARAKDLVVTVDIKQDFDIEADVQKFMQILVNLLSNAFKFTPANGAINVALRENADGTIEVAVRDTGIGMTDDVLARVFDPFFRSADPYVSSSEGTGLGLAISREAASQMGFTLSLESAPGRGTTAILHAPAKLGVRVAAHMSATDGARSHDLSDANSDGTR